MRAFFRPAYKPEELKAFVAESTRPVVFMGPDGEEVACVAAHYLPEARPVQTGKAWFRFAKPKNVAGWFGPPCVLALEFRLVDGSEVTSAVTRGAE